MAPKKKNLVTAKEVAKLLKVSPEVIAYFRQYEKLPYIKRSKYILFSEPEVTRWRNRKLANDSETVLELKSYYNKINLHKFTTYEEFKERVQEIAFLEGDYVIQYLRRQNAAKDVQDLVGDIVSEYWSRLDPKCSICGRLIYSSLDLKICHICKKKAPN